MDPFTTLGGSMGGLFGQSQQAQSGALKGGNNAVSFGSFFGDSKSSAAGPSEGPGLNTWLTVASVAVGAISLWYMMRRRG